MHHQSGKRPHSGISLQPELKRDLVQSFGGSSTITYAGFAALPPRQERHVMGEHLYRAIYPLYPDSAVLLTRALLEKDYSALMPLLSSENYDGIGSVVTTVV